MPNRIEVEDIEGKGQLLGKILEKIMSDPEQRENWKRLAKGEVDS